MKLYQATICRVVRDPVRSEHMRVLIHAETPQAAGRLLKKVYPGWEKVDWHSITTRPLVFRLP